ncbi:unnamed protein product, partial [Polarella glacialis]
APAEGAELPEPEGYQSIPSKPSRSTVQSSTGAAAAVAVATRKSKVSSEATRKSQASAAKVMGPDKMPGLPFQFKAKLGKQGFSSAPGGPGFNFITASESDGGRDNIGVQDEDLMLTGMKSCTREYYEGDHFGGWALPGHAPQEVAVHIAHSDVELIVISRAAFEMAAKQLERTKAQERGDFLRRCLPVEVTQEALEKLVPLFGDETKPKGSILVQEGSSSNTIWLIMKGRCSCRGSAGAQVPGLTEGAAHAAGAGSGQPEDIASPRALRPASPSLGRAKEEERSGAPSQGRGTGGGGAGLMAQKRGEMALGILEEGQFVGLASALLHELEPLTVTTASPEVMLLSLRIDNLTPLLKIPKLLDALREMTRAQLGWHESRFARIEHLPSQVNQKAERMRSEMMRAQIPLVIDSPFLRRKGQAGLAPGMVALEAVCKHFGSMVHPESEWIESLQNRNFFENMVLANASTNNEVFQKLRNAEAKEKADHGNANERFQHFSKLSFRLQQPDRQAMTASISLADSAAHWGPSTAQSSQPQVAGRLEASRGALSRALGTSERSSRLLVRSATPGVAAAAVPRGL